MDTRRGERPRYSGQRRRVALVGGARRARPPVCGEQRQETLAEPEQAEQPQTREVRHRPALVGTGVNEQPQARRGGHGGCGLAQGCPEQPQARRGGHLLDLAGTGLTKRPPVRGERAMVTAEIAIGVMLIAAVLLACIHVLGAFLVQVRCTDAAAEIARQDARGETRRVVTPPQGSQLSIRHADGRTEVVVSAPVEVMGGFLGTYTIRGRAVAVLEPGVS